MGLPTEERLKVSKRGCASLCSFAMCHEKD